MKFTDWLKQRDNNQPEDRQETEQPVQVHNSEDEMTIKPELRNKDGHLARPWKFNLP
jgi:hypothetical protein